MDEKLVKKEYWTYKDRAKEQKEKNLRSGQYDKPVQYDKKSTPKSRFIHDLMVDFAIYLRKWAEQVDYEFPEKYYRYAGMVYDLGVEDPRELPDGVSIGYANILITILMKKPVIEDLFGRLVLILEIFSIF